ncbi:MurR/RpiR family transcriptional regulator [Niallia alba]|uniref:MurR/RpiR family transcriptional regulator n=1 Tax=Niallia circulans TaxID=1397 RepID=A0A941JI57_NIACI|nr:MULTISPECIES: MurR/RpiR family transcriptional regulator [Niallia]MCB5237785.1 MurR/RpiR family transcriptional regulator [Niallia circulans]MDU1846710.1 MurR/RpiR family transcriptional regulator [Niallia nealsonii]MED3793289.1 MurR/RpiR family transcriptional regulator [Niallia alba]
MTLFFDKLNSNYENLSESEQEVIDFILKFEDIEHLKLKDIQDKLFLSSSTIIRACKKIGYSSFIKFKYDLLNQMNQTTSKPEKSSFSEVISIISNDFEKTVHLLSEENIQKCADYILQARRIFCMGIGSSSSVVAEFNRKLKLIDKWSNDYSEKYSIERIPDISGASDLLVIFSLSGETKEINETALKTKRKGTKIVSITSISNNSLSVISDFNLFVYSSPSSREKLRSRLMLNVAADLIFENLSLKTTNE